MGTMFSDNFNRSDNDSLGSNWHERDGDWDILSNRLRYATNGGQFICLVTSGNITASDYKVSAKLWRSNFNEGVLGRWTQNEATFNYDAYLALQGGGSDLALYRSVNGSFTLLGTTTSAWTEGDTIMLSMQGTTIKFYHNGVEKISVTDSNVTSQGTAGVRGGGMAGLDFDDYLVEDFIPAGFNPSKSIVSENKANFFHGSGMFAIRNGGRLILPIVNTVQDLSTSGNQMVWVQSSGVIALYDAGFSRWRTIQMLQ